MARRRTHVQRGEHSSLGYGYTVASKKIEEMRDASVYTMAVEGAATFTPDQVMPWFIPPEIREILKAAAPYVESGGNYHTYPLMPEFGVRINDWDGLGVGVPTKKAVVVDRVAAAPLVELGQHVAAELVKWAKVQHVLKWMDRNATVGAIRYYWPTILSLLPEDDAAKPRVSLDLGDRHRTPIGINLITPLIRETAGIVACGLLLPKVDKKQRALLSLEFQSRTIVIDGVDVPVPSYTLHL